MSQLKATIKPLIDQVENGEASFQKFKETRKILDKYVDDKKMTNIDVFKHVYNHMNKKQS